MQRAFGYALIGLGALIALFGLGTLISVYGFVGNLESKYPIEVESCVCRFLAFEADSYSRVGYDEMLERCNEMTRAGHPSLRRDISSEPALESLRCTENVEDWRETVVEDLAQQASNRRNYQEITQPTVETE